MEGFASCNVSTVIEKNRYKLHGFIAYSEFNIYVNLLYGVFISNVSKEVKDIDDLLNYYDSYSKPHPYEDYREL